MSIHNKITDKIISFLDNIYYKNLQKIYNDTLDKIFTYCEYPVIKPEFFIYLQYYFIYTFFYYITNKSLIFYSASLHLTHINGLIFKKLCIQNNYIPSKNSEFLKNTNYLLFMYLLFLKILFLNKLLLLICTILFYSIHNINIVYKERLKCIETKKEFIHPLKIVIITPNKQIIEKIIYNTRFFTYSNYLFFINIMLYMIL